MSNSKFNRKSRPNVVTPTETTEPSMPPTEETQTIPETPTDETYDATLSIVLQLDDDRLRRLHEQLRVELRTRRESRRPRQPVVGSQVTWTMVRRAGPVEMTGEVLGVRRSQSFVRTARGIEIVRNALLKAVVES